MRFGLTALAMGAALLCSARPAAATVYYAIFKGQVSTVLAHEDEIGLFGAPGSKAGEAFTAIFSADLDAPGVIASSGPDGSQFSSFAGGAVFLLGDKAVMLDGLINITRTLIPPIQTLEYRLSALPPAPGPILSATTLQLSVNSIFNAFLSGPDPRGALDYDLTPGTDLGGGFFERRQLYLNGDPAPTTGLFLDVRHVSVAVPEPAAWALMILGFGVAGVALRRRRAFA